MIDTILAQIGDRIEFSISPDGGTAEGRIMDVDVTDPLMYAVQVSPFEPFRQVDLSRVAHKIVYGVGEFSRLKADMVGRHVEILADGKGSPAVTECGVIKKIDNELNCALIAFDDGHKDWCDLTMNAFKVVGRASSESSSTKAATANSIHGAIPSMPRLETEKSVRVHAIQGPLPELKPSEFDWYTEGGHVELCTSSGIFQEGALLCSVRDKTLQLYNENRQFFEVHMLKQSFKVVIHGLIALKSIPLGQAVEIYSPMHAEFRCGLVLKAAEMGRLTPIKFADVGLEWLDLTSQTFKLVFLAPNGATSSIDQSPQGRKSGVPLIHLHKEANDNVSPREAEPTSQEPGTKIDMDRSPSTDDISPDQHHPKHHHEPNREHHHRSKAPPLSIPALPIGHAIELLEPASKQFIKYRIVRVHGPADPHRYDLELVPSSSSGSNLGLSMARATDAEKHMTVDLASVKARVQLSTDYWSMFQPILRGYRVDVYDKVDRSVLNGKITDCSSAEDATSGPRVYVKLKDGSKRWFDVKHTKIKLKLLGESPGTSKESPPMPVAPSPSRDPMWHRVDSLAPEQAPCASPDDHRKSVLARQQSEKVHQDGHGSSSLARQASAPAMRDESPPKHGPSLSLSHVPSLDFSGLVRERADPALQLGTTNETAKAELATETQRSTGSNSEALSDLLPAMDDVWLEEPTQVGETVVMRYIHIGTGEIAHETPQWLKKIDETTGESFILNTTTGVRFQPPGSSSSLTTTPESSGRAAVVTLPIGPLEAARVASQMNAAPSGSTPSTSTTSIDLCAEAFGP